jgi:hypothetical protein
LWQGVGVKDILVNEKTAPATFDGVEMLAMEGNARTDHLHVSHAVVSQRLARAEGGTMFRLQGNLLLKQEFLQFDVRRKLETEWTNNLLEEVLQRPFP